MVENQYFVFSLSMTSSSVKKGRQTFICPSTSPILTFIVTIAIMSLGAITCANCALVSILSITGLISMTFFHGSLISCIQTTISFSRMIISISEKSLALSSGCPCPPSILSIMANPRLDASSMIISPFSGWKSTIPKMTGLESELVNSENVTVSELLTDTCIFFRR